MGSRCVVESAEKEVCGFKFKNYGSNIENYHSLPYFTVASAIGLKRYEIELFIEKLDENFKEFYQRFGNEEKVKEIKEEKLKEITEEKEIKKGEGECNYNEEEKKIE